jgi:CheY-like chemotaxis protein
MTTVDVAKLRILVVDDEPSVGNTIKMLLQFDGHDVEATHNGRDALAMFEPDRFDLIITDYAMPGMNGNQLAAAIKADAPDQPVIMITGHAGTFSPSPSVDFIIGKPFRLEHLREAIAKVMLEATAPV